MPTLSSTPSTPGQRQLNAGCHHVLEHIAAHDVTLEKAALQDGWLSRARLSTAPHQEQGKPWGQRKVPFSYFMSYLWPSCK